MTLSKLEKASDIEVNKWLDESLNLTPYQKEKLRSDEIVRFSPLYFYKQRQKEKVKLLWRISILLYPIYIIVLYIFLPFNFVINGKWGYNRKFLDKFHYPWLNKINL